MEQPLVKVVGGREYAATGAKFGPSHLPVNAMAHVNKSAQQDLAMSAVVYVLNPSLRDFESRKIADIRALQDKQSPDVDTGKHLVIPTSPQRGPVTSTFRPLPKISKPNGKPPARTIWMPRQFRVWREETPLITVPPPRLSKAYATSDTLKFNSAKSTGNLSASYYTSTARKEELAKLANNLKQ
ncbi:unnamed protein product [Sordaria macrospora k-hell]|uniref:WGS project CABT00000000 data, contig 2.30 n=1 Tax=Sordaria macrospora (strain ATCC MYA-333 / DSM 997 / K(L3346) / K-hell) TaxID=771870 RepID=F7W595_SORMK|nr:uncharacterized protein SMAC_05644 [Sordaria macrospora k-hell]CCC12683.1 unnamed protein product [Sordaria macrospora k-hell]